MRLVQVLLVLPVAADLAAGLAHGGLLRWWGGAATAVWLFWRRHTCDAAPALHWPPFAFTSAAARPAGACGHREQAGSGPCAPPIATPPYPTKHRLLPAWLLNGRTPWCWMPLQAQMTSRQTRRRGGGAAFEAGAGTTTYRGQAHACPRRAAPRRVAPCTGTSLHAPTSTHKHARMLQVWDLIVVGSGIAGSALGYAQAMVRTGRGGCASIHRPRHWQRRSTGGPPPRAGTRLHMRVTSALLA